MGSFRGCGWAVPTERLLQPDTAVRHLQDAFPRRLSLPQLPINYAFRTRTPSSDADVRSGMSKKKTGPIGLKSEASEAELEKLHAELVAMQE